MTELRDYLNYEEEQERLYPRKDNLESSKDRIERLTNAVQLQADQIKAILSILKTEWMAGHNIDLVKYTPAEIERMWKSFKNRFGL